MKKIHARAIRKKAAAIGEEERNSKLCLRVKENPFNPCNFGGDEARKAAKGRRYRNGTNVSPSSPDVGVATFNFYLLTVVICQNSSVVTLKQSITVADLWSILPDFFQPMLTLIKAKRSS
uniref:Uncharacterized protein n=2 Tax=Micrurus TaxID=8634 RepID=A0A2D4FJD5_MICCO